MICLAGRRTLLFWIVHGQIDRPADEKTIGVLLKPPSIPGFTESLTNLSLTEWRLILAKLRRAKLLAGQDPHNPGCLDTHPLVREYFGEQLRSQQADAWKESNRRLYNYYRQLAPALPENLGDMEPLFLAVISGCNAGLYREALHEVYLPRIQRGNAYFAANVLGARGLLLTALVHFFEDGRWGSLVEMAVDEHSLTAEDQLFVLMQAGLYLAATRGFAAPEARICCERAEPLCLSLNDHRLLYVALMGQWRYAAMADKMSTAMQIAERVYALTNQQNDATLTIGAYRALSRTLLLLGEFESSRHYALRGVQIWRSGTLWHPRSGCAQCVAAPDEQQSHKFDDLTLCFYTKRQQRSGNEAYLVVCTEKTGEYEVVHQAFLAFADPAAGLNTLEPLVLLQHLVARFGLTLRVGNQLNKFIFAKVSQYVNPFTPPILSR